MSNQESCYRGFLPYAFAAFLIGIVGGFSTVLGPAFVADRGLAYSATTWTALAQAMSTAACAPILGRLGDILGRRKTLLLGIAVFTLGNVLTALAMSLPFMLMARFLTGVGIAAMAPVILAYIVTEFPADKVAQGFSLYMLISSASVVFGPTLGGHLIAARGWRGMQWVCVLICAVIFALCLALPGKPEQRERKMQPFDAQGAVLVLLFFSLVLCIPSFGQNFGWTSPAFLWVLVLAALSLVGLTLVERRAKNPILPGRFFRQRGFLCSIGALFLTQGLMQANMTNLIVFLRYTQPENTTLSGYAISVMYLGMSLGAVVLGPLADRREPKNVLTGSLAITALGCGSLLLLSVDPPFWLPMASLGLLGLGLGGNGTIFMKTALSGLTAEDAGTGTGTYGLFRDLAAPFGVAVFVPLFTNAASDAVTAVSAIHLLAMAELACIGAGIAIVQFLPTIHPKGE